MGEDQGFESSHMTGKVHLPQSKPLPLIAGSPCTAPENLWVSLLPYFLAYFCGPDFLNLIPIPASGPWRTLRCPALPVCDNANFLHCCAALQETLHTPRVTSCKEV